MLGSLAMLSDEPMKPLNLFPFNIFPCMLIGLFHVFQSLLDLSLIDGHVFVELPLVFLKDVCEVFDGGLADSALVTLLVRYLRCGMCRLDLRLVVHLLMGFLVVGWEICMFGHGRL